MKRNLLAALLAFCAFSQTALLGTSLEEDAQHIVVSNPLVVLVGVSTYGTQDPLPGVKEEMIKLYELFRFTCGYETRATFQYNQRYRSDYTNLPEMRLSLGELNKFLAQTREILYQKADYYDGLLFAFSGHGASNTFEASLLTLSDFALQPCGDGSKGRLTGYKYLLDVIDQLTWLEKTNPKESLARIPKIFFNFSCRNKLPAKVLLPPRDFPEEEEEGECTILQQKRYENLEAKRKKSTLEISAALPGITTGVGLGVELVSCLKVAFTYALGQKGAERSLKGIIKHVRKSLGTRGCTLHRSLGVIDDLVFFSLRKVDQSKDAENFHRWGALFYQQGNYQEAETHYAKALEIWLKTLGDASPQVATSYNNLGLLSSDQGRYKEAETHFAKALEIRLKTLGEAHPDVAASYNSLGLSLYKQGKYREANEYYTKALEIRLKVLGESHPSLATSYNNLGLTLSKQGKHKEAEEYHKKDLEVSLKVLGKSHPSVATSYNNLGFLFASQGKCQEAEAHFTKALEIKLKVLGKSHPSLATSYNNLGSFAYKKANYKNALEYFEKALAIQLDKLGEAHPHTKATQAWIKKTTGASMQKSDSGS